MFFTSCKKPPLDYRDVYTGEFLFTTLHNVIAKCYDEPDCIDGWRIMYIDTLQFESDVLKEGTERMKICLYPTYQELGILGQTIFPIIHNDGLLSDPIGFPEWWKILDFKGCFIEKDTISISFRHLIGMGGYDKYEITGVRVQ